MSISQGLPAISSGEIALIRAQFVCPYFFLQILSMVCGDTSINTCGSSAS